MNCRRMAKFMAEFASGELPETVAREVQEHIQVCSTCAEKLRRYEHVLSALTEVHEPVVVPEALDHLVIPQPIEIRFGWRWAGALAFAIIGLICIGFIIRPHQTHEPKIAKTVQPTKVPRKESPRLSEGIRNRAVPKNPQETLIVKQYQKRYITHKRVRPRLVNKPLRTKPVAVVKNKDKIKEEEMVLAAIPSIEFESYNDETCVYTTYSATYDDSGRKTEEATTSASSEQGGLP